MKVWIVTYIIDADFPSPERDALEVYSTQEKAMARHDTLIEQSDELRISEIGTFEKEVR